MQYDIRLKLHYDYEKPVAGGRHLIRVMPQSFADIQRVVAASVSFDPPPTERSDFVDFFSGNVTSVSYRDPHDVLEVSMSARVNVFRETLQFDTSPDLAQLQREIASVWSVAPDAPHHFLSSSGLARIDADITAYAGQSLGRTATVLGLVDDLCRRIYDDFTYDGEATEVSTSAREAFDLRAGVCQDFSHIMIAGLRGLGIPAGYVSGFLRTIPPAGKERLEGADAMHAWVRVWCGRQCGWQEFDPTNAIRAGTDHITVGYGRDYSDVPPILGVLKTTGAHKADQSVDVIPIG